MKAIKHYFHVMLRKAVVTFVSVDEIFECDHSNERLLSCPFCGAVYYAVQGGSSFCVCG